MPPPDFSGAGISQRDRAKSAEFIRMERLARKKKTRGLFIGIALILIGLASPLLFNVRTFGVMGALQDSLARANPGLLAGAAVRLVLLNAVRALPTYLGAFLVLERLGPRRYLLVDILMPTGIIVSVYYLIQFLLGIKYDFRMPAIIEIMAISMILRVNAADKGLLTKVIVVGQLLFGLQWLDIAPALTTYGFGHGEISQAIKDAAVLIEGSEALNLMAFIVCALATANALLTGKFMVDYFRHIRLVEAEHEKRMAVERMKVEMMRARHLLESQALVHDLKTPLTTLAGLASVLEQTAPDSESYRHLHMIGEYCDRMNSLISQVLSGDVHEVIGAQELLDRLSAQLPSEKTGRRVRFAAEEGLPDIRVNVVRMVRALANLINNAVWAVGQRPWSWLGRVRVTFRPCKGGASLVIIIDDNGIGIPLDAKTRIWEPGYSSHGSSGLGLTFAREVINENDGTLSIDSIPGEGTVCRVELPGVEGVQLDENSGN